MNNLKLFIPDFKNLKFKGTQKLDICGLIFCGILVVCVFLPWMRYSTIETGGKVNEIVSGSKLGITTWYGIVGLLTALVATYGVLVKQYALTFWGCILAAIFGLIGANSYADIVIDDNIIFKETFENLARTGGATMVNHLGAKLFIAVACLLAGFSCVKLFTANDNKEQTLLSKIMVGVAAFFCAIFVLESIITTPTFISYIIVNISSWGLLTLAVAFLAYSYYVSAKEGKSNKLNMVATVLMVVAFFFTNVGVSEYKAGLDSAAAKEVNAAISLEQKSYDDRDDQKAIEKKQKDAEKEKQVVLNVGAPISKQKGANSQDGGQDQGQGQEE